MRSEADAGSGGLSSAIWVSSFLMLFRFHKQNISKSANLSRVGRFYCQMYNRSGDLSPEYDLDLLARMKWLVFEVA